MGTGSPQNVGRFADGHAKIANREFLAIFAVSRGWWHSPGPRLRVNRAPHADFITSPKSRETCQTVWRMTQSDANCSPQSNSLLNRENTGNLRDLWRPEAGLQPKKPCLLYGFHRNSLLNRTGNYFEGTGNFFNESGNFQDVSGKLRREVRSEGHVRVWTM